MKHYSTLITALRHVWKCAFLLAFASGAALGAQSAANLVQAGRAGLASHDVIQARLRFSEAVAAAPDHEEANALLAYARILALPELPALYQITTRLGFDTESREVLRWKSQPIKGRDGTIAVQPNLSASEVTAELRNSVVPAVEDSLRNLGRIRSPQFELALSAAETGQNSVRVDLADVRLVQAGLQILKFLCLVLNEWNLDAQLIVIRDFYVRGSLNPGLLLDEYPRLFSYARTNELLAARDALAGAAASYELASDLLRGRPGNAGRLFALDGNRREEEEGFRRTISSIRDSLNVPTRLWNKTNVVLDLNAAFSRPVAPRDLAPRFIGSSFVLGSLPDPTFGGVVELPRPESAEEFLTRGRIGSLVEMKLKPVPSLQGDGTTAVDLHVLRGRSYVLLSSVDLLRWTEVRRFIAQEAMVREQFNAANSKRPARYYRVIEMDEPVNMRFLDPFPLEGESARAIVDMRGAWQDSQNPSSLGGRPAVWFSWTAPRDGFVAFRTRSDSFVTTAVFDQNPLTELPVELPLLGGTYLRVSAGQELRIAIASWDYPRPVVAIDLDMLGPIRNDSRAAAAAIPPGTPSVFGHNVGADNDAGAMDRFQYRGAVWWRWMPDRNGRHTVRLHPRTGAPLGLRILDQGTDLELGDGGRLERVVDAVAGRPLLIVVGNVDEGRPDEFELELFPSAPPAGDALQQAKSIQGESHRIEGTNVGCSREPGEPNHGSVNFGRRRSVWWRWTAPADGVAEVSVKSPTFRPELVVYAGEAFALMQQASQVADAVRFPTRMGSVYSIAVLDDPGDGTTGDYELTLRAGVPPLNDQFANRTSLSGTPARGEAAIDFAAADPGEPDTYSWRIDRTVWWTWTAPGTGKVLLDTEGTAFPNTLGVYVGGALLTLTSPNSGFQGEGGGTVSRILFNATAGVPYQIVVRGSEGASGRAVLNVRQFARPDNDMFDARRVIAGTRASEQGWTLGGSVESGEPRHAGFSRNESIWWAWTAPGYGRLTLDTDGSDFDTILAAYFGTRVNSLSIVAATAGMASRGGARLILQTRPGDTYAIALTDYYDFGARAVLNLNFAPGEGVGSDSFGSRPVLTGPHWSLTTSNDQATAEPGEPAHAGEPACHSIWLQWLAPDDGVYTVSTVGSDFDTVLAVYTPKDVFALDSLLPVASDDDAGGSLTSEVSFKASRDAAYQIAVDGYSGESGAIQLNIKPGVAERPRVLKPLENASVKVGIVLTLRVVATGLSPLSFVWKKNGAVIPGAAGPRLRLGPVQDRDTAEYSVEITNSLGTAPGGSARVVVQP